MRLTLALVCAIILFIPNPHAGRSFANSPFTSPSLDSRPQSPASFRRAEATLDDIFGASCRVNVSGARGSGTFIGVYNGVAYVLTNYHVVENNKSASCDFWTNGKQQTITGSVAWRAYDASMPADFAIIALDAQELKEKVNPPYVALAGRDGKPTPNSVFLSAGGPKGWSVKAWRGTTLESDGKTARFRPHPVPGQSGSGVFEEIDGACWLVGVVTWLIGTENDDNSTGGAIPIANLYKAGEKRPISTESAIPEGAIECQEPLTAVYQPIKIVVFTKDNCPACDAIKADLLQLRAANYPIYACNTSTDKNQNLAMAYGVTEFPTVIILQNDSTPLVRIDYQTLAAGAFNAISSAYDAVAVEPEPTDAFEPPCDESCPVTLDGTESMTLKPFGETEKARVYDGDVGIFSDSEERWQNRNQESNGLADRLVAGLSKQISASVQTAIINASGELVGKLETDVKARVKIIAWRAFALIFWAVVVAEIAFAGVKAFFGRLFKRLQTIAQELQEFREARK